MRAPNYNGQNERKRAPATPPLRFLSFLQKKRNKKENKMIIFEFRNKTHYTQKGILPDRQHQLRDRQHQLRDRQRQLLSNTNLSRPLPI